MVEKQSGSIHKARNFNILLQAVQKISGAAFLLNICEKEEGMKKEERLCLKTG